jgi:4-carboxymuconolactone decarboxylase
MSQIVDYAERRARGRRLYEEVMHRPAPDIVTPRVESLIDFIYAEIWSRGVLTRRERRLVTLTLLAGTNALPSLADHCYAALVSGDLTYDELHAVVLHFAVYCGWGKAEVFERVLEEQWALLHTERGEPVPVRPEEPLTTISPDQEQRKQFAEARFVETNCVPAPARGVPYYEAGILSYVFADMWSRPELNRRDRRWVTLACVGIMDAPAPITSHVYSAMRTGDVTAEEMGEFVLQFAPYAGWPKGSDMQMATMLMQQ